MDAAELSTALTETVQPIVEHAVTLHGPEREEFIQRAIQAIRQGLKADYAEQPVQLLLAESFATHLEQFVTMRLAELKQESSSSS